MTDIATLIAAVDARVEGEPSNFGATEQTNAVNDAFAFYQQHRTNEIIEDIAGSGVFDLTLPATYDQEKSRVTRVEYPAGQRVPCYLNADQWLEYDDGGGTKVLRLLDETPATGETVRITFTAPYTLATVPSDDDVILIFLGCSNYCGQISTYFSSSTRSTIGTDSAEHLQQQESWDDRSKWWRDQAYELMGFDMTAGQEGRPRGVGSGSGSGGSGGPSSPASSTQTWFPTTALQTHRLTH